MENLEFENQHLRLQLMAYLGILWQYYKSVSNKTTMQNVYVFLLWFQQGTFWMGFFKEWNLNFLSTSKEMIEGLKKLLQSERIWFGKANDIGNCYLTESLSVSTWDVMPRWLLKDGSVVENHLLNCHFFWTWSQFNRESAYIWNFIEIIQPLVIIILWRSWWEGSLWHGGLKQSVHTITVFCGGLLRICLHVHKFQTENLHDMILQLAPLRSFNHHSWHMLWPMHPWQEDVSFNTFN